MFVKYCTLYLLLLEVSKNRGDFTCLFYLFILLWLNIHHMKFIILTIIRVQFSGIKYISLPFYIVWDYFLIMLALLIPK